MGWMNRMRSLGVAEQADALDEVVVKGERYDPYRGATNSAGAVHPYVEIPEEIKLRQTALLVDYVRTLRAR